MSILKRAFSARFVTLTLCVLIFAACLIGLIAGEPSWWLGLGVAIAGSLVLLGVHDLGQEQHSILRNYPIAGHLRYLFEEVRPEMRQYFFESETDGVPFTRDQRAIVYQRAKMQLQTRPFGTQLDVYRPAYEWITHSIAPAPPAREPFRVMIGGPDCTQPYTASIYNISAMSFGALSANAIRALNKGAAMGGFAHDTGEGSLSSYHREHGGDIIWEIGSGYFGCRTPDGNFSPERFAETARLDQVKMIELKLSQGAKPGHGGVLPAAKVSPEIARTRGVPAGVDCVSPARHAAFSTPIEMMQFVAKLRTLSGGKPVGFKLCIGHPAEFLAICKAMLETQIIPDYIVVDGKEGGTGAAPQEFLDHMGMPLREGLTFVHNALVGCGLRTKIRIGAGGKVISAFDIACTMALGADWCNSARGFMFAIGCIQSQTCHTDRCPVGVATQDASRQRALVVPDKAQRVRNFHAATLFALKELVAAAGLNHPSELKPYHVYRRVNAQHVLTFAELYPALETGDLLAGTSDPRFKDAWRMASARSF